MTEHEQRNLIRQLRIEMGRGSSIRYQINLELLDVKSLRELLRLLRDRDSERDAAVTRARVLPFNR